MMETELRCECREPVVRASCAKEDRLPLSGMGGASLFPFFLLLPNNDRPPLDALPDLSPEENMFASACVQASDALLLGCRSHAASGGQVRCSLSLLPLQQSSAPSAADLLMYHVLFRLNKDVLARRERPEEAMRVSRIAVALPPTQALSLSRVCWPLRFSRVLLGSSKSRVSWGSGDLVCTHGQSSATGKGVGEVQA